MPYDSLYVLYPKQINMALDFLSWSVLSGYDTHGRFSAIFYKEDNYCDFLFAFLHTKSVLKRVFSKKERMWPQGKQFFLLE